jgi:hypothetical protein
MQWVEDVLKLELQHQQYQIENGVATRGRGKTGWSISDTAMKLELSFGKVSQDLMLAGLVKSYPELRTLSKNQAILRAKEIQSKPHTFNVYEDVLLCAPLSELSLLPEDYTIAYVHTPRVDLLPKIHKHLLPDSFIFVETDMWGVGGVMDALMLKFTVSPYPIILRCSSGISSVNWRPNYDIKLLAFGVKGSPSLINKSSSIWNRDEPFANIATLGKILFFGLNNSLTEVMSAKRLMWPIGVIEPDENKIKALRNRLGVS